MVKISTFQNQPLQHVQYMADGTVLLKFYDQLGRQPRHMRVSLEDWLAGRGVRLIDSHATIMAQHRCLFRPLKKPL
jgi:hypothetical protein